MLSSHPRTTGVLPLAMDENHAAAVVAPAAAPSKTPARQSSSSSARRAFGDISNRKLAHATTPQDAAAVGKHKNATAAGLFKTATTPAAAVTKTAVTTKPLVATVFKHEKIAPSVKITQPSFTTAVQRRVEFALPAVEDKSTSIAVPLKSTTLEQTKPTKVLWDDETEIEQPAGLLYAQQQPYNSCWDDANDDDLLEGASNFRQEINEAFHYRYQQQLLANRIENERCIRVMHENALRFAEEEGT